MVLVSCLRFGFHFLLLCLHLWFSTSSSEPNSYEKKAGVRVDGHQLGRDFTRLRALMSESKLYRDAGLYGPDVGQPQDHRVDILKG